MSERSERWPVEWPAYTHEDHQVELEQQPSLCRALRALAPEQDPERAWSAHSPSALIRRHELPGLRERVVGLE